MNAFESIFGVKAESIFGNIGGSTLGGIGGSTLGGNLSLTQPLPSTYNTDFKTVPGTFPSTTYTWVQAQQQPDLSSRIMELEAENKRLKAELERRERDASRELTESAGRSRARRRGGIYDPDPAIGF